MTKVVDQTNLEQILDALPKLKVTANGTSKKDLDVWIGSPGDSEAGTTDETLKFYRGQPAFEVMTSSDIQNALTAAGF